MTISSLADIGAMLPAIAIIVIGFIVGHSWRAMLWWCLLFFLGMFLVVVTKIAFVGWGVGIRALDFTGFSGHAMRATAVTPVLCYLLLQKAQPVVRNFGVMLGILFGVIIAVSRLVLHAHSVSEAVAGCALGAAVSLSFIWIVGSSHNFVLSPLVATVCMVGLLIVPFAEPTPTQRWIIEISLSISGHDRPYVRDGWQLAPYGWRDDGGKPAWRSAISLSMNHPVN